MRHELLVDQLVRLQIEHPESFRRPRLRIVNNRKRRRGSHRARTDGAIRRAQRQIEHVRVDCPERRGVPDRGGTDLVTCGSGLWLDWPRRDRLRQLADWLSWIR